MHAAANPSDHQFEGGDEDIRNDSEHNYSTGGGNDSMNKTAISDPDEELLSDFVVETNPMVVFQELKVDNLLNVDRNMYLNARKISYVTLVDVVAQISANKNNLDTFNDDGLMGRRNSVQNHEKSKL